MGRPSRFSTGLSARTKSRSSYMGPASSMIGNNFGLYKFADLMLRPFSLNIIKNSPHGSLERWNILIQGAPENFEFNQMVSMN